MYGNYYQPQYQPQYIPQYNAPQPATQAGIAGKIVNDYSDITIRDIPTDCSPAFFVRNDLSEIQMRRWSDTGNVISEVYRKEGSAIKPDPISEIKGSIDQISKRFDDLEERIEKAIPKATRRKADDEEK